MLCSTSQHLQQSKARKSRKSGEVKGFKAKKRGGEGFQDIFLKIQEIIDTTPEELTEDLMEMSASKPVLDDKEETVPKNKLTLNDLAEGFRLFRTVFDFFYDLDLSMIWALNLKQVVEEQLMPCGNIFRELKKQQSW